MFKKSLNETKKAKPAETLNEEPTKPAKNVSKIRSFEKNYKSRINQLKKSVLLPTSLKAKKSIKGKIKTVEDEEVVSDQDKKGKRKKAKKTRRNDDDGAEGGEDEDNEEYSENLSDNEVNVELSDAGAK